jgi:hypothetical protein
MCCPIFIFNDCPLTVTPSFLSSTCQSKPLSPLLPAFSCPCAEICHSPIAICHCLLLTYHCHLLGMSTMLLATFLPFCRSIKLPMLPMRHAPPPGVIANGAKGPTATCGPGPQGVQSPRGSIATHTPCAMSQDPHLTTWRNMLATALSGPCVTNLSFFTPAQAHVAEFVQSALVATSTTSPSAKAPSFGTGRQGQPGKMSKEGWSLPTALPSVLTGRYQGGCTSTSHTKQHRCSGCGKSGHGAQACPQAEKA